MNQNEFDLSNYIIQLVQKPNTKENLGLLLNTLFDNAQKEKLEERRLEKAASSVILFTQKELSKMPQQFRKIFKAGNVRAHVRKRSDGLFEIRCMINGQSISAVSKFLDSAKTKFIAKLNSLAENTENKQTIANGAKFCSYIDQWLETAKKPHVKDTTYKDYVSTVKLYIKPNFETRTLEQITFTELQALTTKYQEEGKNRTAKKIYQLLCGIFDAAVADRIIPISPMLKVKLAHYEPESGIPFTRDEEKRLLDDFKREPTLYRQAFVFMLYSGIRRSELASVTLKDGWIYVVTAKQRKGFKEKIRALPIPPMLNELLSIIHIEEIVKIDPHLLTKHLHKQFKNHHCHDLRHTFITRAQECGIRREYVSLWAGHKADNSITSNVYTHLEQNKELQIDEMDKFDYTL